MYLNTVKPLYTKENYILYRKVKHINNKKKKESMMQKSVK